MRRALPILLAALLVLLVPAAALAAGAHHPSPEETNQLRIIQFLGFGIIFILVALYGFPVIARLLRERGERIAGAFEDVEAGEKAALEAREAAQKALKDIERESDEVLQKATKEGAALKDNLVSEATAQAARIAKKAAVEVEVEHAKLQLEASNQMAEHALAAAEKVLEERVDRAAHDKIVDRFLQDLEKVRI